MSEEGEGEERDGEREREGKVGTRMGSRGRESEGGMIARNSSPGRCGVEGIIPTLPALSRLLHLSKRV